MTMDFSLTVFWSVSKVMYNFGENFSKTYFTIKSDKCNFRPGFCADVTNVVHKTN